MRIILFDIDSLRPDHLGCYGYHRPTSPIIDSLASEGTIFTHYYCADAPCMPSRHNLITGRFGINSGVVTHAGPASIPRMEYRQYGGPAPHNQLLQRHLREQGIDTISITNFTVRHTAVWFALGWSELHSPTLKTGGEIGEEVNACALRWLKNNAGRDNYFLHINYWDVHRPYKMDESWKERFADSPIAQSWPDEETIVKHQDIKGPFTAQQQFKDNHSPFALMPDSIRNRTDFEQLVDGYDASIAYADYHVGLILEELKRQGVLDETVIIITADHGEALGEHGIYGDHVCADEAVNRIPLIIRWPGVTNGRTCDEFYYNVDLSATLCEMAGAKIPEHYDGQSFLKELQGEAQAGRDYLVWGHGLYTLQRAVRTRDYLMVRTYDDFGYPFKPVELYEIEKDPHQTNDVAAQKPEVVSHMDHLLMEWLHEQSSKPSSIPDPLQVELRERKNRTIASHILGVRRNP